MINEKGESVFNKKCHSVFDAKNDGKDYLARGIGMQCRICGRELKAYHCGERLYLVECECCEIKAFIQAPSATLAASRTLAHNTGFDESRGEQIMDIDTLITRLRDIAWDFPPEHSINRAADMLTVLQAENNKLQDELKCREAEIARLNEAREIANEKAREYEKKCQELGNFDHLRELAEADKEGRCVVLPCKVGDTIYKIPSKVNFELNVLTNHSENNRVYEQIVNKAEIYDNAYLLVTCDGMDSVFSAFFENSWFLTREAAEAALKERERNE